MRIRNLRLLGLALVLTATSSCAVSMKMRGNRFESSEVYGKTAFRLKTDVRGQANVELTDDYTLRAPNTQTPDVGPTHNVVLGAGVGIKERFELSGDTSAALSGKFQILGDPKLTAEAGNFSLSVLATVGGNGEEKSGSGVFSNQQYKIDMSYGSFGGAILAGYRVDRAVNLYFGPTFENAEYEGDYEVVGVSNTHFEGKGRTRGAVVGLEVGTPRVTGMIEGAWQRATSASARNSFWVAGAQIIISFGSTDPNATTTSARN